MTTHLEASLQQDLEQIRSKVVEMGGAGRAGDPASIRAVVEQRPPARLRGDPARPVHRRGREAARPALPAVPGPPPAGRQPAALRLRRDQGQPGARAGRRLRREHRPPGAQAHPGRRAAAARPPAADRQPGRADAARRGPGFRPPGCRAGPPDHRVRRGGRPAARQADRRPDAVVQAREACRSRRSTRWSWSPAGSSGSPTRRATSAWRRSTCAPGRSPSTPAPTSSRCSSSTSTTPAAASWPRRSAPPSASPASSSRAPASTRCRSQRRDDRLHGRQGLRRRRAPSPGPLTHVANLDHEDVIVLLAPRGQARLPAPPAQHGAARLARRRPLAVPGRRGRR